MQLGRITVNDRRDRHGARHGLVIPVSSTLGAPRAGRGSAIRSAAQVDAEVNGREANVVSWSQWKQVGFAGLRWEIHTVGGKQGQK